MIAVIPARGGSKGVPRKNIRLVNGLPLIAYSIKVCLECKSINRVFVSTDCEEIAGIAISFGAEAPFLRPGEFAQDRSSDLSVMIHFLDWYQSQYHETPDSLLHVRPTTPIRNPQDIEMAIQHFRTYQDSITAMRSMHEMPESAYKMMEIDPVSGMMVSAFSRKRNLDEFNGARQTYPKTYLPNGYIDILKSDTILNQNQIHGDSVLPFVTQLAYEVDTEDDIVYLEWVLQSQQKERHVGLPPQQPKPDFDFLQKE